MYMDVEKRGLLIHRGGKKKMEKRANAHNYTYTPAKDSGCVRVLHVQEESRTYGSSGRVEYIL